MSSLAFLLTTSPSWLLATHLRTALSNTLRACALSSPVGAAVVLALARHGLQEEEGAAGQQHAVRGGVLRRHADLDTDTVCVLMLDENHHITHLGPVLEPGDGGRWLAGLGGGLAAQRGGLVPGHQHVRGVLQQPRRGPAHPWSSVQTCERCSTMFASRCVTTALYFIL